MPHPIRHLPLVQNWDCHARGTCCKEYQVTISEEERQRILDQNWDKEADLGGREPIVRRGLLWNRRYLLNHTAEGNCVFLSEEGRCRMHERFGYESKPLPCRLFPFVLVPVNDHWRVGMRFACPSAAENLGRPLSAHDEALRAFANELVQREHLGDQPDGGLVAPPYLQGGQRVPWPEVLQIVETLTSILRNSKDTIELRLRKCLQLSTEMRKAKLGSIEGARFKELVQMLKGVADSETPKSPEDLTPPRWIGRILFRQAAALFTRKDHGPNRGLASGGRIALLRAAWRFTRGTGAIPRMHKGIPETTFESVEEPTGPLPSEASRILERYYLTKVGSLQFCGGASFGLPFWEGFEILTLTYPILLWVARMYQDVDRTTALTRALTIVDDHVGFNRVLASFRQRLSFSILVKTGELQNLIGWYSR